MSTASIASVSDSHSGNKVVDAAPFLSSSAESNVIKFSSFQSHGDIDPETVNYSYANKSNKEGMKHPRDSQSSVDAMLANDGLPMNASSETTESAAVLNIPEDLKQILTEVAQKGSSSIVPWKSEDNSLTERSIRDRPLSQGPRGGHVKHEYHRSNDRSRNGSHKRARISMSSHNNRSMSDRQKLHRSYFSSGGRSTTTSTMVMEPSVSVASSAKNIGYPMNGSHSSGNTGSNLFLIRTTQSSAAPSPSLGSLFSPGSAGSGRTSGSEHEDTSQYECDSEGTSATSNSELSFSANSFTKGGFVRRNHEGSRGHGFVKPKPKYASLKDALTVTLSSVLDFYYQNRGGYKLAPAEKHKISLAGAELTLDQIFQNRKKHLLDMLRRYCDANGEQRNSNMSSTAVGSVLPPFTIQRIAEVLMEPERYYTQTHKLCNCLEKLLLVTASATAFGTVIDEDSSHMHRRESESTAVLDEKTRLRSEFRQSHRRTRRRTETNVHADKAERRRGLGHEDQPVSNETLLSERSNAQANNEELRYRPDGVRESQKNSAASAKEDAAQEALEAAARATLRTKFDHVGIDPHSTAALANSRDVQALIESRRLTNSPPPPVVPGGLRPLGHRSPPSPSSPEVLRRMSSPRVPSPVLFNHSFGERSSSSPPPLAPSPAHSTAHSLAAARNVFALGGLGSHSGREAAVGSRSPTSSEDLDSTESDFDDSASDRSDGSDSEARAMALSRMQQRLQGHVRSLVLPTGAEDSGESDASDAAD